MGVIPGSRLGNDENFPLLFFARCGGVRVRRTMGLEVYMLQGRRVGNTTLTATELLVNHVLFISKAQKLKKPDQHSYNMALLTLPSVMTCIGAL